MGLGISAVKGCADDEPKPLRFANSLNPFLAQKRQVGQKPDRKTMRSCQFQNFPKLQVKRGLATRQLQIQKEFSLRPVAQDVGKLL